MKYHERARAILRSGLRAPLRLTLLALSDHADKDGVCFPSIATLEHETGLSRRAVQEAIRDLVTSRVLGRTDQLGVRTTYRLQLGALPTAERKPKRIRPPRSTRTHAPDAPVQEAHPPGAGGAPGGAQEARGGVQEAHPNGSVTIHLDGPGNVPVRARESDITQKLWQALMHLYVGSGHGKTALDLDGDRPATIRKCLDALHRDSYEAARRMVHLLAYWLYGPEDFWRTKRRRSAIIGTLLRHTEIGVRFTEAADWVWDGEVRARAGPEQALDQRRQSNASREIARLLREAEEEEQRGISQDHPESDPLPPGLRVLQLAPGG